MSESRDPSAVGCMLHAKMVECAKFSKIIISPLPVPPPQNRRGRFSQEQFQPLLEKNNVANQIASADTRISWTYSLYTVEPLYVQAYPKGQTGKVKQIVVATQLYRKILQYYWYLYLLCYYCNYIFDLNVLHTV
jgi:hypothetical protein